MSDANSSPSTGKPPKTPIQRLRKRLKLTIADLADLAEVRWGAAKSWDNAETYPSAKKALRLINNIRKVKGVEVELEDLVGRA